MEDEEQLDEEIQKYEELLKGLEDKDDYPKKPFKDNALAFFRHILGLDNSSKVGNLEDHELGAFNYGVRFYQNLALTSDKLGMDTVKAYFMAKSEIVLATSLSKRGFLAELLVTQIKKEQKAPKRMIQNKGWFSKKEPQEVPEDGTSQ